MKVKVCVFLRQKKGNVKWILRGGWSEFGMAWTWDRSQTNMTIPKSKWWRGVVQFCQSPASSKTLGEFSDIQMKIEMGLRQNPVILVDRRGYFLNKNIASSFKFSLIAAFAIKLRIIYILELWKQWSFSWIFISTLAGKLSIQGVTFHPKKTFGGCFYKSDHL